MVKVNLFELFVPCVPPLFNFTAPVLLHVDKSMYIYKPIKQLCASLEDAIHVVNMQFEMAYMFVQRENAYIGMTFDSIK